MSTVEVERHFQDLIQSDSIDVDKVGYLNHYEKRQIKKLRKNYKAKLYQRGKKQNFLQEIYELQIEKERLKKELLEISRERDKLWDLELRLLRAL